MSNKMAGDWQYYRIEKRLDDIQDLLGEVLRRLGKLEYSGTIKSSDGSSPFGSKEYRVNVTLEKKDRWDRLSESGGDIKKVLNKTKKKKKVFTKTDIHGNKIDDK